MEVGEKIEWWRIVIGREKNIDREVVIFCDKFLRLEVVIF